MLLAMSLSAVLVTSCILVHYETLRFLSAYVPILPVFVRGKVLVVVLGCFLPTQLRYGCTRLLICSCIKQE
jgi:hypothetical protein